MLDPPSEISQGRALPDQHDASPGPCLDCPNFALCAREPVACEALRAFTRCERWQTRPRSPLASTYREIFKAADLPRIGGISRPEQRKPGPKQPSRFLTVGSID
jgi:hypothetical protein